jgi:glucose-1-phosphate cytidylyltransferase
MKVVLLCGGLGTRIRDQHELLPKPLIPIGGRPIVWHIMDYYARQGFRKFVLCLGYRHDAFVDYFLNYRYRTRDLTVQLGRQRRVQLHASTQPPVNWRVTLADTGLHTSTGGRVRAVAKYLRGDTFLLTYGDGLCDVDLHDLVAFHRAQGKLATVTAVHPAGRFGEIDLEGPRVQRFAEKPQVSSGYINGGFMVLQREFIDRYLEDDCVLEADALARCARDGELTAYCHDGFWQCMDTPREHALLEELWASGQAPWASSSLEPVRQRVSLPRKG